MFKCKNKKFTVEATIDLESHIHNVETCSVESAFNKVEKMYSLSAGQTIILKLI